MQLDLHIMRFDWAGGPSRIGPGVADLTQRAEAIGVRTVSFMDHYFQMDWMAPAEDPMLEGYTALGFVAGQTERLRLRLLLTRVTYRHPRLLAKIVTTLYVVSGCPAGPALRRRRTRPPRDRAHRDVRGPPSGCERRRGRSGCGSVREHRGLDHRHRFHDGRPGRVARVDLRSRNGAPRRHRARALVAAF